MKRVDVDAARKAVRETLRSLPAEGYRPLYRRGILTPTLPCNPEWAKELIERGEALPPAYRQFVLDAVDGKKGPRGTPRRNFFRNFVIVMAIERALDHGLNATRNDGRSPHSKAPDSACDVVSSVLEEHNIYLSPKSIRGVWNVHVRRRRRAAVTQ